MFISLVMRHKGGGVRDPIHPDEKKTPPKKNKVETLGDEKRENTKKIFRVGGWG